ncbi:MAG: agmatine deiminase family protein, partial [Bacteroidota bacterium]
MAATMNSKRRLPAEWEAQSFVQFTFPHPATDWAANYEAALACFVECIAAVSQFTKVLVVCEDPISTKAYLHQIPVNQLRLVALPSNDTWARDHGGITIWEDGKAVVLDFQFNAWGLKFAADKDNRITRRLYEQQIFGTATLRTLNFVLEGGSIESDGQGTLLTTSQCLLAPNRNPQFERADIEQYLTEIFGLKRILWLEN